MLEALSRDGKIAVASSVTAFAVASILFFIVGFLCGYTLYEKRSFKPCTASKTISSTGDHEGTLQVSNDVTVLNQKLELKDNVAYGPMRSTSSQPVPLYEDVNVLPGTVEHQEQGLELRENVAYCGASKSMTTN